MKNDLETKLNNKPYVITAWATDFVSALYDRPLWTRLLFRLACGKGAYREFCGIVDTMKETGHYFMGDDLEDIDYRNESMPVDWVKLLDGYDRAF